MTYRINVPNKLNYSNIHSLIISFEKYERLQQANNHQIILDLSNLIRIDTEGLNYIALLPFHLKLINENILIILPNDNDTILFLEYTNLLKFLFDNFSIYGYKCIEDYFFLKKLIKADKTTKKVRVGLIKYETFDYFLRNELSNLEKIISHAQYSKYFCMCFYELSKNIFEHSGENIGSFAFHLYSKEKYENDSLRLTISDIGVGLKKTIAPTFELPIDKPDSFYIEEAIKPGITSTKLDGRGLGLYQVINFASEVQINSGNGQITVVDGVIKKSHNSNYSLKGTSLNIKVNL